MLIITMIQKGSGREIIDDVRMSLNKNILEMFKRNQSCKEKKNTPVSLSVKFCEVLKGIMPGNISNNTYFSINIHC